MSHHTIEAPGLGAFVFRRRTMRDQVRIEAEALRILGGPTEDRDLHHVALAMATLLVLQVQAPDGWDVEALDPLDQAEAGKLWQVYGRLRTAEESFRAGAKPGGA